MISRGASEETGLLRGVFSGFIGFKLDLVRGFLDFDFSGSPVCGRASWKRLRVNWISAMWTPPFLGVSAVVSLNMWRFSCRCGPAVVGRSVGTAMPRFCRFNFSNGNSIWRISKRTQGR